LDPKLPVRKPVDLHSPSAVGAEYHLGVRLAEWVPPMRGALSRHTRHQHLGGACNWGTQARPSGAPKQAAETMPISQGDARAAERGRGEGGRPPWTYASCVGNLGVCEF
jgi:hypothetical protein